MVACCLACLECWRSLPARQQGGKLIAEETEKWGKVVKFAGIKAD